MSATPGTGTYTNATGVWDVRALSNGAQALLAVRAMVISAAAQTNTATVTDVDQFDPNTANDTASATETPQQADLAILKTVNNPTPNVGDQIVYTITLTNGGPDDATGVAVTDLLPAGVTYVSNNPSQGTYDNVTGIWTVGTVTAAAPATMAITVNVADPAVVTNTATITDADQFDPNTGNNTDTADVDPQQADLTITKTVSDTTPNVGDQITFTVTLTSGGFAVATGVQVTDLLPAGVTYVSANASQGTTTTSAACGRRHRRAPGTRSRCRSSHGGQPAAPNTGTISARPVRPNTGATPRPRTPSTPT